MLRAVCCSQSTVSLVQELRDQLSVVQLSGRSCSDCGQADITPESPSPSSPSGKATSPPVAVKCASPQPAARSAKARLHSAGLSKAPYHQHSRAAVYSSAPQPFSNHSTSPSIAAARSALLTRDATEDALSDWHQSKVQQQQEAAMAYERLMEREEQMLSSLAAAEEAAHTAHQQVSLYHSDSYLPGLIGLRLGPPRLQQCKRCGHTSVKDSLHTALMCTAACCALPCTGNAADHAAWQCSISSAAADEQQTAMEPVPGSPFGGPNPGHSRGGSVNV